MRKIVSILCVICAISCNAKEPIGPDLDQANVVASVSEKPMTPPGNNVEPPLCPPLLIHVNGQLMQIDAPCEIAVGPDKGDPGVTKENVRIRVSNPPAAYSPTK